MALEGLAKLTKDFHTFERRMIIVVVAVVLISTVGSVTAAVVAFRESQHAQNLAQNNARLIKQDQKLRRQRAELIELNTRQNCYARHLIAGSMIVTIKQSIAQIKTLIKEGVLNNLGPKIIQAQQDSIVNMQKLITNLQSADCDVNNPSEIVPAPK